MYFIFFLFLFFFFSFSFFGSLCNILLARSPCKFAKLCDLSVSSASSVVAGGRRLCFTLMFICFFPSALFVPGAIFAPGRS